MAFNLNILPLENIFYQKCLIPKDKFPVIARPGQWAKCYFKNDLSKELQNYAVAQIFPRDEMSETCYLDASITGFAIIDDRPIYLEKIVLLQAKSKAESINVIFYLNSKFFVNNSSRITKSGLQELAQIILQKYHITNKCWVKDCYFSSYGVDSLYIEMAGYANEDTCYSISDSTLVNITNVRMANDLFDKEFSCLNIEPFTSARKELDNIIQFVKFQHTRKRALRLNLNVLLVGAVGSGKTTLLETFLKNHRCNVFNIEITQCLKQYPGETEAELRKIFKAACDFERTFQSQDPTVVLLEEIHLLCPQTAKSGGNNMESLANNLRISSQLLSLVDELHSLGTKILCLATTSKPDSLHDLARRLGRFENEVSITALQEEHRYLILNEFLTQSMPKIEIPLHILTLMAKQTQGYVLADLALLVRNITQIMLSQKQQSFEVVAVNALKKSKPISLKGSDVTAYRTIETFDSIGGMFHLKKILEVSVLAGLKQHESFKRFGLRMPKGVLLYGPPGCGKTTIAKCLATEANMTFIATSGAEVYSPYVGCAEKFIAKIFQTARKNAPCLIFLDEIDSLVGRRTLTSSSSSADVQVRILSTLLTEMDGVFVSDSQNDNHILVVAATNRPDMVDDALMRPGRFDKLIHVPAPDFLSRLSILDLCKQRMPFANCVDLDNIARRTDNFSGADLCNVCNEAAMHAFQTDFNCNEIKMQDFDTVLKTTKSSLKQDQIDLYYQFENKFIKGYFFASLSSRLLVLLEFIKTIIAFMFFV